MREGMSDRAVSTSIGYALTLGVASLLITGLLIAGGGFLQDQRENTARTELEVIGEQVSADLSSADRLSAANVDSVQLRRDLPDQVTGSAYTISVENDPQSHLVLNATDPDLTVRVDVAVQETTLQETSVDGGRVQVRHDSGQLVLENVEN